MAEAEQVKTHTHTFRDGTSITVSDKFDGDTVRIDLTSNAGTAKVTTTLHIRERSALTLGQMLVKHHNHEPVKDLGMEIDGLNAGMSRLVKENMRLQEEIAEMKSRRRQRRRPNANPATA